MAQRSETESRRGTTPPDATARALVHYLPAALLVRLADEGARVALVLLALQRTGSAGTGGMLVAALLIPHVIAAPVVGALTDGARQPRCVLTVAAAGFGAALAGTGLVLGRVPLALVLVMLVLGGCCGPALTGGLTSQLSRLVPEDRLPRVFGADSLSYNIAGIVGPTVVAVVAGVSNPMIAIFVLSGCAALGAVLLSWLPTSPRPGTSRQLSAAPLSAGITAVARNSTLAIVTVASSVGQFGPGALAVVAAVISARQDHPAATGWLLSAVAIGGLIGSLVWTWRPVKPQHSPITVMIALVGIGLPLALAAGTASLPVTGALFATSGIFLGPLTGALFTTRQINAPAAVQAQVFTIGAGLKTTATAAGAAVGGAFAGLSTAAQLMVVAASPLLAGSLGALALSIGVPRRSAAGPLSAAG